MRTDQNLGRRSFRFSESWKKDETRDRAQPSIDQRLEGYEVRADGKVVVHSLSGNERNHLFMNREGKAFEDISTISGLDNPADSRGWVLLDYDRDGWQDLAVVNANRPLFNLYRNRIGELDEAAGRNMIAVRFIGGNKEPIPSPASPAYTNRDGYGAMVEVKLESGALLKREHRCGDGYSSQNSATMIVGIGQASRVASVKVRWPSGKSSLIENVPAGSLLTAYENPADAPEGKSFAAESYRKQTAALPAVSTKETLIFPIAANSGPGDETSLRVFTTTATWCAACIGHLPDLETLKSALSTDGVELVGLPIDEEDDVKKLDKYVAKYKPAYKMFSTITSGQRKRVTQFLAKQMRVETPVLPSTVITDGSGRVLRVMTGIPNVSEVRKLLD